MVFPLSSLLADGVHYWVKLGFLLVVNTMALLGSLFGYFSENEGLFFWLTFAEVIKVRRAS